MAHLSRSDRSEMPPVTNPFDRPIGFQRGDDHSTSKPTRAGQLTVKAIENGHRNSEFSHEKL